MKPKGGTITCIIEILRYLELELTCETSRALVNRCVNIRQGQAPLPA